MSEDTKLCPRCGQAKPWHDFHIDRRRQRPGPYCKPCLSHYKRGRYVPKTPNHASACKACGKAVAAPTRSTRPKLFCSKECSSDWHNANQTRDYRRDSWMRSRYGIGLDEYNRLLDQQGGRCGICSATEAEAARNLLYVDHDHATGRVRGLLCHTCNLGLGMLGDDPAAFRRAADYLEAAASR